MCFKEKMTPPVSILLAQETLETIFKNNILYTKTWAERRSGNEKDLIDLNMP